MKTRILATLLLAFTVLSCAQNTNKVSCTPNITGSGMSVYLKFVGDNTNGTAAYSIQLCQDAKPAGFGFSVYGMNGNGTVTDLQNQVRLAHVVSTSSYSGSEVVVDFRSLDTHFVIYLDDEQNGSFVLASETEMVRGGLAEAASTVFQLQ